MTTYLNEKPAKKIHFRSLVRFLLENCKNKDSQNDNERNIFFGRDTFQKTFKENLENT